LKRVSFSRRKSIKQQSPLAVANLLAARISPDKQEEAVFEIVNQLNRGSDLITSAEERKRLAALNLMAGQTGQEIDSVYFDAFVSRRCSSTSERSKLGRSIESLFSAATMSAVRSSHSAVSHSTEKMSS
jgi:hypothetical protein